MLQAIAGHQTIACVGYHILSTKIKDSSLADFDSCSWIGVLLMYTKYDI
jgi:hypothetical protein